MDTPEALRQQVMSFGPAVWQLNVLAAAIDSGLLARLGAPRSAAEAAEGTGLPPAVAARLLDVLAAMGWARREGDRFSASPGLAPLLAPAAFEALTMDVHATLLQSRHMWRSARDGLLGVGWTHDDAEILQSQGRSGGGGQSVDDVLDMIVGKVLPAMDGVVARLAGPDGRFLDVGAGVCAISMAYCRRYPGLRCVALEPGTAPLAEARKNLSAAGLAERIELRAQYVQDLTDEAVFDLAWLPQPFLPAEVYEAALARVLRALRPGGWLMTAAMDGSGDGVGPALTRLRATLWGGGPATAAEIAVKVARAGFGKVTQLPSPPGSALRLVIAQRG